MKKLNFILLLALSCICPLVQASTFQMPESLSPNLALGVRYDHTSDRVEIFNPKSQISLFTISERVSANGEVSGAATWSPNSKIVVVFKHWTRVTNVFVAWNNGREWQVIIDPLDGQLGKLIPNARKDAKCEFYMPITWKNSNTLSISDLLLMGNGEHEAYSFDIIFDGNRTTIKSPNQIPVNMTSQCPNPAFTTSDAKPTSQVASTPLPDNISNSPEMWKGRIYQSYITFLNAPKPVLCEIALLDVKTDSQGSNKVTVTYRYSEGTSAKQFSTHGVLSQSQLIFSILSEGKTLTYTCENMSLKLQMQGLAQFSTFTRVR